MKKTLKMLGLLLTLATLVTCDVLEKADDVTFSADVELDFVVDENGEGNNAPYSDVQLLDLTSNSEISKYSDKIKEIKIDRITYRVVGYDASPHNNAVILNSGTVSFGPFDSSTPEVTGSFAASAGAVNLQTTTVETDLHFNTDQINEMAKMLLEDKQIKMYSEGTLSQIPVAFTVRAKFYFTITANALE